MYHDKNHKPWLSSSFSILPLHSIEHLSCAVCSLSAHFHSPLHCQQSHIRWPNLSQSDPLWKKLEVLDWSWCLGWLGWHVYLFWPHFRRKDVCDQDLDKMVMVEDGVSDWGAKSSLEDEAKMRLVPWRPLQRITPRSKEKPRGNTFDSGSSPWHIASSCLGNIWPLCQNRGGCEFKVGKFFLSWPEELQKCFWKHNQTGLWPGATS